MAKGGEEEGLLLLVRILDLDVRIFRAFDFKGRIHMVPRLIFISFQCSDFSLDFTFADGIFFAF